MYGYALVQTILSGGDGTLAACVALLVFSGLLRPFEPSARALGKRRRTARRSHEAPPKATGDRSADLAMSLNAIELALLAELSLEQASAHDGVANHADQRPEIQLAAAEAATAWRERARQFQLEARRRSGHPIIPGRPAQVTSSTYTGPERRRQMRRRHARRGGPEAELEAQDRRNRRTVPERRRRDRRRRELAPR
jgi:hypothetical protein